MTCNFQVGQSVVCVNDNWSWAVHIDGSPAEPPARVPMLNEVLTVNRIEVHFGRVLLGFAEVANLWGWKQFKPLTTRGTEKGMSILRNLLNKTDKPVEVDA